MGRASSSLALLVEDLACLHRGHQVMPALVIIDEYADLAAPG
jgi:hypothetical protein